MDWQPGRLVPIDKDDVLDWRWDFRDPDDPFLQDGENLISHVVLADAGITVVSDTHDADAVTVWLTAPGATPGVVLDVAVSVATSEGRELQRTVRFAILEK